MSAARVACAVLVALVLLASACGGGDGGANAGGGDGGGGSSGGQNGGGESGGGQDGGGEDGDDGSGDGGGEDGGGSSEFALDTQLDLGQPFAEDPMFDGTMGPVRVSMRADRSGGELQVPITIRLTNAEQASLEDVSTTISFTVLPGTDPEDPPVPGAGEPPLDLAPQTTAGSCATQDATPSSTTIACTLGTLPAGGEATITATSPHWYRLSIGVEVTARGP